MELCNGNCGLICDDSDEEDDSSPTNSPLPPRRIVPSPPLPPRRPSPSPTPNNHLRNGRHLTVPKENAPPPPSAVTVILNYTDNTQQNNKGIVSKSNVRSVRKTMDHEWAIYSSEIILSWYVILSLCPKYYFSTNVSFAERPLPFVIIQD